MMVGRPFPKGVSGNPSGRPTSSKHKLSEAFIAALFEDFAQHGCAVIARVRDEKPDQYIKVVASVVPKDLNLNIDPYADATDADLKAMLVDLSAELEQYGIAINAPDRLDG